MSLLTQLIFCLSVLLINILGNSYGHGGMVSSPNLDKLEQAVNQYFGHVLSFVTDNNPF